MKMKNKKDKKNSKHKKSERKEKKKHKKVARCRSSSSSSGSTSNEEVEWVEKKEIPQLDVKCTEQNSATSSKSGQELAREEWMSMDSIFPCAFNISNEKKTSSKKKETSESSILSKPGQSSRELNPYWKDGGNGLPQTDSIKSDVPAKNAAWLRKSLRRAKEQAEEEGRSLDEIAEERWGSLKTIESMIEAAERTEGRGRSKYYEQRERYDKKSSFQHERYDKKSSFQHERYDRKSSYQHERSEKRLYKKPMDDDCYTHSEHKSYRSTTKNWQKNKNPSSSTAHQKPENTEAKESPDLIEQNKNSIKEETSTIAVVTEADLNKLGARIVKAEIMGDTELAANLKSQLEKARETAKSQGFKKAEAEHVVLTRMDSKGIERPLEQRSESKDSSRKRRRVATHEAGERVRHFYDDDKYSLQQLFQREKGRSTNDDDAAIANIVSKHMDMNEIFEEQIAVSQNEARQDARERAAAISEHKRLTKSLDNCRWCVDSKHMLKHMIVAMDSRICLSLPSYASLTEGHCILTPVHHIACQLQLDEDIWEALKKFKQVLCKLFKEQGQYPVFFEVYKNRNKFSHMQLECVPLPIEIGESAPMYFKKALLECETEWSINKKVIDLKDKTLRQAIPVGLSYFVVQFGLEGGYGHVIEDAQMFPSNFAEEIIGGMLDLDHESWRKPRKDSFDQQREKVLRFTELWKKYDCDGESIN